MSSISGTEHSLYLVITVELHLLYICVVARRHFLAQNYFVPYSM